MPTHIGIGFSQDISPEKAAKDAAFQSKSNLNQDKIDFSLVISSIHYPPQLTIPVLQRVLNNARMIGCSSAGMILSDKIYSRGIAVLTVSSQEVKFGIGSIEAIGIQESRQSGIDLAKNTLANFGRHQRQLFFVLIDSSLENYSLFLEGIQEVLGNIFPIIGAGSCDDFHFQDNFQIYQNSELRHAATSMMLGGAHITIGVSGQHGWRALGKPRIITQAQENKIISIDGKEASHFYNEYFQEEAKALTSAQLGQMALLYPLGIFPDESRDCLLRNVINILPDGSIVCQGYVPQGAKVHIMIGNKASCLKASTQAAQEAKKNLLNKTPKLVIVIESMARLKLLGRMASNEIDEIRSVFGHDVPIFGFFANGEIYPFETSENVKKPHFQNESIVVLALA